MKRKQSGVMFIAIILSVLFGLSFLASKIALEGLDPFQVMASRWTVAFLGLLFFVAIGKVKVDFKGKKIKMLILFVLTQPCLYGLFEIWGLSLATVGESVIILASMPVFVVAISGVALKTKIAPSSIGWMLLAFVGVVVTVIFSKSNGIGGFTIGYIVLLLATLSGAVYNILSERLSANFSPMELTFAMGLGGSIFFNGGCLIQGNLLETYHVVATSLDVFMAVLFLGIVCSLGCFYMYNYVLSHMPAHKASTITINVMTLTGVAAGVIFRGEPLAANTIVGMVLILIGVIGINYGGLKNR